MRSELGYRKADAKRTRRGPLGVTPAMPGQGVMATTAGPCRMLPQANTASRREPDRPRQARLGGFGWLRDGCRGWRRRRFVFSFGVELRRGGLFHRIEIGLDVDRLIDMGGRGGRVCAPSSTRDRR